jgi:hypothetical protein
MRIGLLNTLYKDELYAYNTYYTKLFNALDEHVSLKCNIWLHFKRHVAYTNMPEVYSRLYTNLYEY